MTDAAARYQSLDGQSQVTHNLVYNPTSGNWELEQQAVLEAVTGNLYLLLDDVETLLTAIQVAVEIMDDWDESDRAKVNPIVGQAGIAAGAGAVGATVPRVTLASDDPLLALQEDHQNEFKLADWDASGDPIYVGKTDKAGNWIITEFNVANGTARYIAGSSDYATNWTGRAGLSYDPYYTEF